MHQMFQQVVDRAATINRIIKSIANYLDNQLIVIFPDKTAERIAGLAS